MITSLIASAASSGDKFASFEVPNIAWAALVGFIAILLCLDLLLVHRNPHDITFKEAAIESAVWITIGLLFTFVFLFWHGAPAAGEYLSGYLIEKSLSVDNVFVWAVIFGYFSVPNKYQFRVLFWGIFGALILRAIFIFAGVALIEKFSWILYVFGAFLIFTAIRISRDHDEEIHPEKNPVLKLVRKVIPSTNEYDGQKLFTRRTGRLLATPLFAVLILIETTDVVFAVDSIPAILAVTREPFIVFASNAFAILGLRSLYFLLAGMAGRFKYLNKGLGVIMAFVGVKMMIVRWFHFPIFVSLGVIIGVLTITIWLSLREEKREESRAKDKEIKGPEVPAAAITFQIDSMPPQEREKLLADRTIRPKAETPLLVFGDDGSPDAEIAWNWINSQSWVGWEIEAMNSEQQLIPAENAAPTEWTPPWERNLVTSATSWRQTKVIGDPRVTLGDRSDASLIVLGLRGTGYLKALWAGSVTEWLMHHPPRPLLIARQAGKAAAVVVLIDGSTHSTAALDAFIELPWANTTKVTLISVDDGKTDVAVAMQSAQDRCASAGIICESLILKGSVKSEIDSYLKSSKADLIVLGTRGLTGLTRVRLGSTAAHVVHHAKSSCLLACDDAG